MPDIQAISKKLESKEKLSTEERNFALGLSGPKVEIILGGNEEDDPFAGMEDEPEETKNDPKEEPKEEAPKEVEIKEESKEEPKEEPKTEALKDDVKAKLEAELGKPEGHEDLRDYSSREKAYFYEMRKFRRRAQKAERENEEFRFKEYQNKLKLEDGGKETKPEPEDQEEFISRKDAEELAAKRASEQVREAMKQERSERLTLETEILTQKLIRRGADDAEEVLQYADSVLGKDREAMEEIQEAKNRGGNYVETAYNLIKSSPAWSQVEKQIKAERADSNGSHENKDRAKRMEDNKLKPKTLGSGDAPEKKHSYTATDIKKMSYSDYSKLPKDVREKLLKGIPL